MILLEILDLFVEKHQIVKHIKIGEALLDVGSVLPHVVSVPFKNSIDIKFLQVGIELLDQHLRGRLLIFIFVFRSGN